MCVHEDDKIAAIATAIGAPHVSLGWGLGARGGFFCVWILFGFEVRLAVAVLRKSPCFPNNAFVCLLVLVGAFSSLLVLFRAFSFS